MNEPGDDAPIAVVGAGPVGCLAALHLAERGFNVCLYETRTEASFTPGSGASQRSINLALSTRGLTALAALPRMSSVLTQKQARKTGSCCWTACWPKWCP